MLRSAECGLKAGNQNKQLGKKKGFKFAQDKLYEYQRLEN